MKKSYTMFVMTNPVEGREDEYNNWYSNQHIPDVLRIPGIVAAQRYKLSETQRPNTKPSQWRYFAMYKIESDDVTSVFNELNRRRGTSEMPASDALAPIRESYIFEEATPLMLAKKSNT